MRIIALLLVTIFSFKNSALAEDKNPFGISLYGSFLHTERVPNALFFFDKIKDGDSFELRKALRDHDIEIVVLSSPGGSVYEGLTMAGILHDKKLTTYIPKKNLFTDGQGDCASACAYMYFAGSTRVADGKLGVHQFASKNADDKASIAEIQESAQTVVSDIAGLLGDFEVPAFVYPKMFQSREMYYFKESELAEIERVEKEIGYKIIKEIDRFTNDLIEEFKNAQLAERVIQEEPKSDKDNSTVPVDTEKKGSIVITKEIRPSLTSKELTEAQFDKMEGAWYFNPNKKNSDTFAKCTPLNSSFYAVRKNNEKYNSRTITTKSHFLNYFYLSQKAKTVSLSAYFICQEGGYFETTTWQINEANNISHDFVKNDAGNVEEILIYGKLRTNTGHQSNHTLSFTRSVPQGGVIERYNPTPEEKLLAGNWTLDLSKLDAKVLNECGQKKVRDTFLRADGPMLVHNNSFDGLNDDNIFLRIDLSYIWFYMNCLTDKYDVSAQNTKTTTSQNNISFVVSVYNFETLKTDTAVVRLYRENKPTKVEKTQKENSLKQFEGTWYIATDIGHPERCSSPNPIKLSYQDGSLTNNFGGIFITEKSANGKIYCSRGYAVLKGEPRGSKSLVIYTDYCVGSKCVPQAMLFQKSKPSIYVKPKNTVKPKTVVGKGVNKSNKSTLSKVPSDAERRGLIRVVQENLNRLGCDAGLADGIFGAKTLSALERFNNANSKNYQEKDLEKYETVNSIKSSSIKCKPLVITHPKGTFYGYKLWDASMCKGLFSYCPPSGSRNLIAVLNPNSDLNNVSNMPKVIGGAKSHHCDWYKNQQICYYWKD